MSKTKKSRDSENEFYCGVIAALVVVFAHDEETIYRDIMRTEDEVEWPYLVKQYRFKL